MATICWKCICAFKKTLDPLLHRTTYKSGGYITRTCEKMSKICLSTSSHQELERANKKLSFNQVGRTEDSLMSFRNFDKLLNEQLEEFEPPILPLLSVNFADFANTSKALQTLILFGVKLYIVKRKYPESTQFLVKLDLNKHIKPKLQYLKSIGITASEFGDVLTRNILILDPKSSVSDLEGITDYLRSKKFTTDQIASIVTRFSETYNFPVVELDGVLGFYQKLPTNYENKPIHFSGDDIRSIITKSPQLVGASLEDVYLIIKMLEVSCQFTVSQIRQFVLHRPNILLSDPKRLEVLYKLYVKEMRLSHEQLVKNPFVFDTRLKIVERRHFYLKSLGRNRYKEDEQGYLPLYNIICCTDEEFCSKCQLGSFAKFEQFLKTL